LTQPAHLQMINGGRVMDSDERGVLRAGLIRKKVESINICF
jgi:hypothetical protein